METERTKPNRGGGPDGLTIAAMEIGSAMAQAALAVDRPELGVELAARSGRAARAAYLALIDIEHPESAGASSPVCADLVHTAYQMEWARLMQTPQGLWDG